MMKRYSVSGLRQNLAQALGEVEQGRQVVVERRGARFRIVLDVVPARARRGKAFFEVLDPALLEGQWGWELGGPGEPMRFVARKRGQG
jgi:antitoxin (DNA-binding transcriptional repressor) of toxin-antitoxin stability system